MANSVSPLGENHKVATNSQELQLDASIDDVTQAASVALDSLPTKENQGRFSWIVNGMVSAANTAASYSAKKAVAVASYTSHKTKKGLIRGLVSAATFWSFAPEAIKDENEKRLHEMTQRSYLYHILMLASPKITDFLKNTLIGKSKDISDMVKGYVGIESDAALSEYVQEQEKFLSDLVSAMIPKAVANLMDNYLQSDSPKVADPLAGTIIHVMGIINKNFEEVYDDVQKIVKEWEPKKDWPRPLTEKQSKEEEKYINDLRNVFKPLAVKLLKIAFPGESNDFPLIKRVGTWIWNKLTNEVVPDQLADLYLQFMNPQSKLDIQQLAGKNNGPLFAKVVKLVSQVVENRVPEMIKESGQSIAEAATQNIKGISGAENREIASWINSIVFTLFNKNNAEMQKLWKFISNTIEPVVAYILSQLSSDSEISVGSLLDLVLKMRADFVEQNDAFIQARLKELKAENKNPAEDPVLIEKFQSLALTILQRLKIFRFEFFDGKDQEVVLLPIAEKLKNPVLALLKDQLPRLLISYGAIDMYDESSGIKKQVIENADANRKTLDEAYTKSHVSQACHALAQYVNDLLPEIVLSSDESWSSDIYEVIESFVNGFKIPEFNNFVKTNADEIKGFIKNDLQGLAERKGEEVQKVWPGAKPFLESFFLDIFNRLTGRIRAKEDKTYSDKDEYQPEFLINGAIKIFGVMKNEFKKANDLRKKYGEEDGIARAKDVRVHAAQKAVKQYKKEIKSIEKTDELAISKLNKEINKAEGKVQKRKAKLVAKNGSIDFEDEKFAKYLKNVSDLKEKLKLAESAAVQHKLHNKAQAKLEKAGVVIEEYEAREIIVRAKKEIKRLMHKISSIKGSNKQVERANELQEARDHLKAARKEFDDAQAVLNKGKKEKYIKPIIDKLVKLVELDPENINRLEMLPKSIRSVLFDKLKEGVLPAVLTALFNKLLDQNTINKIILASLDAYNESVNETEVINRLQKLRQEITDFEQAKQKKVDASSIDKYLEKAERKLYKILGENEKNSETVKLLLANRNDWNEFDKIIANYLQPKKGKDDTLQSDLNQATGELMLELLGSINDPLLNKIMNNAGAIESIGKALRQSLGEDWDLLKLIDKGVYNGLTNLGPSQWEGDKDKEKLVGVEGKPLQYRFARDPDAIEAEELESFEYNLKVQNELKSKLKDQPKQFLKGVINSWWTNFQHDWDRAMFNTFGPAGKEVKSFFDKLGAAIFFTCLGGFFMFIGYPVRKAVKALTKAYLEKLANNLEKNFPTEFREDVLYRSAEQFLNLLEKAPKPQKTVTAP